MFYQRIEIKAGLCVENLVGIVLVTTAANAAGRLVFGSDTNKNSREAAVQVLILQGIS